MNQTRACIHRNFRPAALLIWAAVLVLGLLIEGMPHDQAAPPATTAHDVHK